MKTIVYILKTHRGTTWSIAPDCSVENAMKLMVENKADAVPVLEAGMALMTEKHTRHLPVMASGKLSSIVSMEDLLRTIISDQKDLIQSLENRMLEIGTLL